MRRLRSIGPWVGLWLVALSVRVLRFGLVFTEHGVRFPHGADEMYHLRRIWFGVVNFPKVLSFDPYVNYPVGAPPVWPPLFDGSIAALARLLAGVDQAAVEVVAAWVPPVLGAATVVTAAWLARRTFSPAAGWATGALLAVQPAHVFYSTLGEVDHHVAVGLFVLLLIRAAQRIAGPPDAPDCVRAAVACGLAIAAALLLWPGALLYVAVLQAYLGLQLLATREAAAARRRAGALAGLHATACVVLLPFCAGRSWEQFGPVSPLVLSNFQPLWFGAGTAALVLTRASWVRPALGATRARRLGAALGLVALGLAGAWLFVPGLARAVANAASWFEPDPFLGVVAETQPLLYTQGPYDPSFAHDLFSYLFWTYPVAAAWLTHGALRARHGEAGLLLFASSIACMLALLQGRFTDVAGPAFALVLGPALTDLVRAVGRRLPAQRAAPVAAGLLCAAAAASPYADDYAGDLRVSLAARSGTELGYRPRVRQRIVLERVGRWLKQNTPETGGYLEPTVRPTYGVLAAWGHGHQLRYQAERPMVQDNFGPYAGGAGFAAARAYYASSDEESAAEIAEQLGARYVVAAPQGSGQSRPLPRSLAARLALSPGRPLPGLERHRLVFAADDSDLVREPGRPPWPVAVYEVVAGARVVGRTTPGVCCVSFELLLSAGPRAPLRYLADATVERSGAYEVRLPHPSPDWVVRSGPRRAGLALSEADVREGRSVAGPSFER